MGYQTKFNLKIHEGDKTIQEVLREQPNFYGLDYAIDEDGEMTDAMKWYSHEEDMVNLSVKYPELVFVLQGKGEEQGDSWFKYFKNGSMQDSHAKITFEPYDESKLRKLR